FLGLCDSRNVPVAAHLRHARRHSSLVPARLIPRRRPDAGRGRAALHASLAPEHRLRVALDPPPGSRGHHAAVHHFAGYGIGVTVSSSSSLPADASTPLVTPANDCPAVVGTRATGPRGAKGPERIEDSAGEGPTP